jgi:hypothetical protein
LLVMGTEKKLGLVKHKHGEKNKKWKNIKIMFENFILKKIC